MYYTYHVKKRLGSRSICVIYPHKYATDNNIQLSLLLIQTVYFQMQNKMEGNFFFEFLADN